MGNSLDSNGLLLCRKGGEEMSTFNPDSFEGQVLQRLTAVEVEIKNLKRSLNGRFGWPISGGFGGGVAVGVFLVAKALGWL